MPTGTRRPPGPPAEAGSPPELVQELLVQVRALKVQNERLRLEAAEASRDRDRPDPRLAALEAENRRLREELAAAREERDELRAGIDSALAQLRGRRR